MADVTIPHLAVPFTVRSDGSVAVVQQDSVDEVTQCVMSILLTIVGERLERPEFGVPDMVFAEHVNRQPILAAVTQWEPRAAVILGLGPDLIDPLIEYVRLQVGRA